MINQIKKHLETSFDKIHNDASTAICCQEITCLMTCLQALDPALCSKFHDDLCLLITKYSLQVRDYESPEKKEE